jgi:hypothetical protein
MKKYVLPILLLTALSSLSLATAKEPLGEAYSVLIQPLSDARSASSEAYDAFRKLVLAGEDGWKLIFDAQFTLGELGDTTRNISSLWETSGIPDGLLKKFDQAERKELLSRSQNETWALLYAHDYEASRHPKSTSRGRTYFEYLAEYIGHLAASKDSLLMDVAFLRVNLASEPDFPGHAFPWNGSAEQKSKAVQAILDWWKIHGKELDAIE